MIHSSQVAQRVGAEDDLGSGIEMILGLASAHVVAVILLLAGGVWFFITEFSVKKLSSVLWEAWAILLLTGIIGYGLFFFNSLVS